MKKSKHSPDKGGSNADRWENSPCPKYVPRTCPESGKLPREHFPDYKDAAIDLDYTVEKLQKLISDPVTKDNIPRLCRLVNDYVREVRPTGFKLKHLSGVIQIMEYLTSEENDVKEYDNLVDELLEVCRIPPLLEKSSESLTCLDIMKQYFMLLGYLLGALPMRDQFLKVRNALHSLISNQVRTNPAMLSREICIRAAEQSNLPVILAELLEASFPPMYPLILELIFLLASVSDLCCWKMLETGVLNTILIRLDLTYAIQAICTQPPDTILEGIEHSEMATQLIMNTLWCLMYSIFPPKEPPDGLLNKLKPARCALWGLRYSFERHVCFAQNRASDKKVRNELAVLILMGLIKIPAWNLVHCGIADNIVKLAAAIDKGTVEILSRTVKFGVSKDELHFQKILLLIVAYLANVCACKLLLVNANVMETILELVNPELKDQESGRNSCLFVHLSESALYALTMLAPNIPHEFIKHKGIVRLSMILEWSASKHYNEKFVSDVMRCVCRITFKADATLIACIRDCGIIFSLLKLAHHILEFEQQPMVQQRNLTLALITIEAIMRNQMTLQEMYEDQCITLAMKLLYKSLYQRDTDFQVDQRLFVAIGIFIWGCIVACTSSLTKFVDHGAVYIILDILEIITYPVQCLFLGLLTDMCDSVFCGVYLSTWRGIDKNKGVFSLLASIWRQEEIRIQVRSSADGTMEDVELPQMGQTQWCRTYQEKLTAEISPAILDMLGSTRPKIYSIRKIIERDSQKYELVREKYKILYNYLPVEDRVTLASVRIFFRIKLGQVWVEVSKYLDQIGVKPLGMDSQMMATLMERYYSWGLFTKEQQNRALQSEKIALEIHEKDEYARIKNSTLCGALDALDELDYILRVTDRNYMLEKKCIQRLTADRYLRFPKEIEDEHCHRTFQENINITVVFDQNFTSASAAGFKGDEHEIQPVSPPDSRFSLHLLPSPTISNRSALLLENCGNPEAPQ